MISRTSSAMDDQYGLICDVAHAEARAFIEHQCIDIQKFFDQKSWPKCACKSDGGDQWMESPQFLSTVQFILRQAQLRIIDIAEYPDMPSLPKPQFASWLYISSSKTKDRPIRGSTGATIGLDSRVIKEWFKETAVPVNCQLIRTLLHEFGHWRVSPNLVERPNYRDGFSADASPEEEEKAWVFAIIFLSILVGDYALESRKSPQDKDDVPKLYF